VSARPLPSPVNPALLQHAKQRRQSLENRLADQITRFAESMRFVYLHTIWFASWIGLRVEHYPFGLLTMIVSLEAIFLSTFVMISQNRADEKTAGAGRPAVADGPGGGAAERGAAPGLQPHPGAHQGDPRDDRGTSACRPDPTGRRPVDELVAGVAIRCCILPQAQGRSEPQREQRWPVLNYRPVLPCPPLRPHAATQGGLVARPAGQAGTGQRV
jgi:hypothetical protein